MGGKIKTRSTHLLVRVHGSVQTGECKYLNVLIPQPGGEQLIERNNVELQNFLVVVHVTGLRAADYSLNRKVGLEVVKIQLQQFQKDPMEHDRN